MMRGRRRAEVEQSRRSLAGGVMSPAVTHRCCVSRWFDTGCAAMLGSRLDPSAALVCNAAAIGIIHVVDCFFGCDRDNTVL